MADEPSPPHDLPAGDQAARVWLIAGPTASGKSDLALALAQACGGEIVNADALQLYRELSVITARPTPADEALAPHHLYGVAEADEAWSVGRWLRAVVPILEAILGRDRPAIVVGGTGLYFRALTEGLAEIPEPPVAMRTAAAATYDERGEADFRIGLALFDAEAEARIVSGDKQRLVRAFAVFWGSGKSLSHWRALTRPTLAAGAWRGLVVEPPRDALYRRIDARVADMLTRGAVEEAAALTARRLDPDLPILKAVGLRELAAAASGHAPLTQARDKAAQASRRYAKRQLTWFRNQTAGWPRVDSLDPAEQLRQAFSILGARD